MAEPLLWWCKTDRGDLVEHESTPYEGHKGHVRCVPIDDVCRAAGSPPPTPAPTDDLIRRAEAADAERDAALNALAALAQSDREPLWRGKTSEPGNFPEFDEITTSEICVDLPVPPGTAVRVEEDTGS